MSRTGPWHSWARSCCSGHHHRSHHCCTYSSESLHSCPHSDTGSPTNPADPTAASMPGSMAEPTGDDCCAPSTWHCYSANTSESRVTSSAVSRWCCCHRTAARCPRTRWWWWSSCYWNRKRLSADTVHRATLLLLPPRWLRSSVSSAPRR